MGITIGSGIFRVPSSVAQSVDSVGAIALLWILGGVLSLCLALSLSELASMFPRPGGIFVFLREAYGPVVAFVFGWTFLLINPASWAGISLIFAEYLGHFVPLDAAEKRWVAAALIALITVANYRSVPLAAAVQNVATSAKALALLGLAVVIFALGKGSDGALAAPVSFTVSSWGGFGVALIGVLFTYEGAAAFCALSGEVRDPARNLPRALLYGVALVTALYLLVNAAYLYVLPIDALKNSSLVAADAMTRVAGHSAASLISALVMLSTFGAVAATAIADPRVFCSMAREGLFFQALGKVHRALRDTACRNPGRGRHRDRVRLAAKLRSTHRHLHTRAVALLRAGCARRDRTAVQATSDAAPIPGMGLPVRASRGRRCCHSRAREFFHRATHDLAHQRRGIPQRHSGLFCLAYPHPPEALIRLNA